MNDLTKNLFDTFNIESETPALYTATVGEKIQTSEEIRNSWLRARWAHFTASNAHKLMTNGKVVGELSAGAKTYIKDVAIQRLCLPQTDEGYTSPAMSRGLEQEVPALDAFMERTGLVCTDYGLNQKFLELGPDFGGSPDCLIPSENSGVEVKAPNSATHVDYMGIYDAESLKSIAPDYYWQVQSLCLITGAPHWHFVSWDDRFKNPAHRLHIALIEANSEDIAKLISRLEMAIKYRDEIVRRMSTSCDYDQTHDRI
jgi:hypothetical protein